jgi:hypothetical protein
MWYRYHVVVVGCCCFSLVVYFIPANLSIIDFILNSHGVIGPNYYKYFVACYVTLHQLKFLECLQETARAKLSIIRLSCFYQYTLALNGCCVSMLVADLHVWDICCLHRCFVWFPKMWSELGKLRHFWVLF